MRHEAGGVSPGGDDGVPGERRDLQDKEDERNAEARLSRAGEVCGESDGELETWDDEGACGEVCENSVVAIIKLYLEFFDLKISKNKI